jgi:hypothetical protein
MMVNKIIIYECQICKKCYTDEKEAEECEQKGVPELYPIGMVFAMDMDNEMVFAVIKQYPKIYPHHHGYSTWACRDTPAGDNAEGEQFCGLKSWDKIYPPNKQIPAYKRMINALKKASINPVDFEAEGD